MQGMDLFQVQPVQGSFPHGPEISFHLGSIGAVPYRCVQEYGAVGKTRADDHAGVVVDDDDEVDLMCLFVRSVIDVAEVAGIGLPESAKGILFKCLPVLPVQFP